MTIEFNDLHELKDFIRQNLPNEVPGVNANTKTVKVFTSQHTYNKVVIGLQNAFMNKQKSKTEVLEIHKPIIPPGMDFRRCSFQLRCNDCFESISVSQLHVLFGVDGKPLKAELRRAFKNLFITKECPTCKSKKLIKEYSYESRDIIVGDDLPF